MSGLYIHIPFCKKACHYCDFHFSTNQSLREQVVHAICTELRLQKDYLNQDELETVYLGGGTPSILTEEELTLIFNTLNTYYKVKENSEVTLEANPDDLTPNKLYFLRTLGVNRLSIGIQSFNETHLRFLNRSHSAAQAQYVVDEARKAGFSNISLDLIYAIPAKDHKVWEADVETILTIKPEHISAYCLTIEEKTAFGVWQRKGKLTMLDDDFAAYQYEFLLDNLDKAGYNQYEVSNFSLPLYHSKHNSNYWKQKRYLGIGPGAHSYNGISRQSNISNNVKYLKSLEKEIIPFEVDLLTSLDKVNEYILTNLRTSWGLNMETIKKKFGQSLTNHQVYIQKLVNEGIAYIDKESLVLTRKGMLFADKVASDLFFTE